MALISCENLSLGYENKSIVDSLSFSVNTGEYLCILGENGAGKSTLIKTLLHLMPPLSGTITYGDGLKQKEIGYLPQQTEAQKDFPASVFEIVLSGCLNRCGLRPFYTSLEKQRATNNLEKLGIAHLAQHCYRELSGGQQQRVLLARALCATQKLLLLDEPVSGLDPQAAIDMYQIIKELNKKTDIAIIMVSHDVQGAIQYADHILYMNETPLFFHSTEAYLASDIGSWYLKQETRRHLK